MSTVQTFPLIIPASTVPEHYETVIKVEEKLELAGLSLADAIKQRELYFRVSVTGSCNLSCLFCHNEGAAKRGSIDIDVAEKAIIEATSIGFNRVQFTGGEPLLRKDISKFVYMAKQYADDVGITTNGTYLMRELDNLTAAGITRIHVSLQTESLIEAGSEEQWGIPDWLEPTIKKANSGAFKLRLNLPVPSNQMNETENFLTLMEEHKSDVKVFSVLPEGEVNELNYPLDQLEKLVHRSNERRALNSYSGEVVLRGFRPPAGLRCPTCVEKKRCKEQSHSLRLGADLMLRPCLASREWDVPLNRNSMRQGLYESALLALDY